MIHANHQPVTRPADAAGAEGGRLGGGEGLGGSVGSKEDGDTEEDQIK